MVEGQNESMITNNARFIIAPALVTTPAYQEDPDPHNALDNLDFLDDLRAVNGVNEVAHDEDLSGGKIRLGLVSTFWGVFV